jgi:hypothetical protein
MKDYNFGAYYLYVPGCEPIDKKLFPSRQDLARIYKEFLRRRLAKERVIFVLKTAEQVGTLMAEFRIGELHPDNNYVFLNTPEIQAYLDSLLLKDEV